MPATKFRRCLPEAMIPRVARRCAAVLPGAALAGLAAGCAVTPQITRNSVDFNAAIENADNAFLVDNILRARDRTPLYFTAVSQVHGSLQETASTSLALPFGPGKPPGKLYNGVLGGSFQITPNFDVAPLDTQEFTQGILAPLDLKVIKYFWDRPDYPKWLLANLFISKIEAVWPEGRPALQDLADADSKPSAPLVVLPKSTELPRYQTFENDPDRPAQLQLFKRFIFAWVRPEAIGTANQASVRAYSALEPVGPAFPIDPQAGADAVMKVISQVGTSLVLKHCVSCAGPNQYRVYRQVSHIVICPPLDSTLKRPNLRLGDGRVPSTACDKSEIEIADDQDAAAGSRADTTTPTIIIYQRSVEQIVTYLGAIVRANEQSLRHGEHPTNPVGFYLERTEPAAAAARVNYRNRDYYVGPFTGQGADPYGNYGGDYTLKVLTLLNELINLNKVAKDIPTTKTVATSP